MLQNWKKVSYFRRETQVYHETCDKREDSFTGIQMPLPQAIGCITSLLIAIQDFFGLRCQVSANSFLIPDT
jgi:hypothetical protein